MKKLANLCPRRNLPQQAIDYRTYILTWNEWLCYALLGTACCALVAYTFYRSLAAFLMMLPLGLIFPWHQRSSLKQKRKDRLKSQFKEGILILAARLSAGYSIENAVSTSVGELSVLYGEDELIVKEFSYIVSQLRMNRAVEIVFKELGIRSGVEDISNFSEILAVAKRSGGELVSIINHSANIIHDKLQVQEDIVTLTAAKRYEQKIMNLIPFLIVIYIDITSPGFFEMMYQTMLGRIVMSICLAVYIAAYCLAEKILEIEV